MSLDFLPKDPKPHTFNHLPYRILLLQMSNPPCDFGPQITSHIELVAIAISSSDLAQGALLQLATAGARRILARRAHGLSGR